MFCAQCGAAMPAGARFCAGCGQAVPPQALGTTAGATARPSREATLAESPSNAGGRRATRLLLIAGAVVVVVVLVWMAAGSLLGGDGTSGQSLYASPNGWVIDVDAGPSREPDQMWDATGFSGWVDAGGALIAWDWDSDTEVGEVRRFDPVTGGEEWSYDTEDGYVPSALAAGDRVLVSGADRLVALAADDGEELWDINAEGWSLGSEGSLSTVVGDRLVFGGYEDGSTLSFQVRDLADGTRVWSGTGFPFRDGERIVTVYDGELRVTSLDDGRELGSYDVDDDVTIRAVGDGLAVLRDSERAWVVSLDDGEERFELPRDASDSYNCSILDGLLGCDSGNEMAVYDLGDEGREVVEGVELPGSGTLVRLAGEVLIAAGPDEGSDEFGLFDARTGERRLLLSGISDIEFAAEYVLAVEDGELLAYDVRSGDEMWSRDVDGDYVMVVGDGLVVVDYDSDAGEVQSTYFG